MLSRKGNSLLIGRILSGGGERWHVFPAVRSRVRCDEASDYPSDDHNDELSFPPAGEGENASALQKDEKLHGVTTLEQRRRNLGQTR
jgi:hypothetical protein